MLEKLLPGTRRAQWAVLVACLFVFALSGVFASTLAERLGGGGWFDPDSQSSNAVDLLKSGFPTRGEEDFFVVVRDERHSVADPQFAERARAATKSVLDDERLDVSGQFGWYTTTGSAQQQFVGKDGRVVVTAVGSNLDDDAFVNLGPKLQTDIDDRWKPEGMDVTVVGTSSFWGEVGTVSTEGLTRGELIVMPLILLIMLLLYRSVAAALVSSAALVVGLAWTFGALGVLSHFVEMSVFVQNSATMIGLGMGVDFALFIISRYREGIVAGDEPLAAARTALRTSGRTIVVSTIIVVFAAATLFLIDLNAIRSIALGVALSVVFAALSSLVMLPVILALLGRRALAWNLGMRYHDPREAGARWGRVAAAIMRKPVVFLVVAVGIMVALALPALGLRTETPDLRILPDDSRVRAGYETVTDQFGPGVASPITVVVESDNPIDESADRARLVAVVDKLKALPDVTVTSALTPLSAVGPEDPLRRLEPSAKAALPQDVQAAVQHYVSDDRRKFVIDVATKFAPSSDEARAVADTVRDTVAQLPPSMHGYVGGETAEGVDTNEAIASALPWIVAAMLAVIFLVLLVAFRSLLLPIKAILVNIASLAATYGILIAIFRYGFGTDLLGWDQVGYLQNFVPALLLVILFGLSTDYELFVLNRIREEYLATGDNETAVVRGVAVTAPLVSGAALLMVAVFGGFALASILPLQQLGLGLALGVILDATIVRLVIVPAAMRLMGRYNWWLPGAGTTLSAAPTAAVEPEKDPVT